MSIFDIETVEKPRLEILGSSKPVAVRILDITTRIRMSVGTMFDPTIKRHTTLASQSYSFLIENEELGRKIIFDLGTQRKWQEQASSVVEIIKGFEWNISVDKNCEGSPFTAALVAFFAEKLCLLRRWRDQ